MGGEGQPPPGWERREREERPGDALGKASLRSPVEEEHGEGRGGRRRPSQRRRAAERASEHRAEESVPHLQIRGMYAQETARKSRDAPPRVQPNDHVGLPGPIRPGVCAAGENGRNPRGKRATKRALEGVGMGEGEEGECCREGSRTASRQSPWRHTLST